jgi:predicted DNA binding CopG/RHH family protein
MTDTATPRKTGRPYIGRLTTLRLPDDLLAQLSRAATARGIARAELIRRLLAESLSR